MRWRIEYHRGRAGDLLAREPAPAALPAALVFDLTAPALILGSTQPEGTVDTDAAAAAGVDVVRRRSGGGAVLVVPGDALWLDVLLPAGDRLWSDDVGVAFHWLGTAWAEALGRVGVEARVYDGAMRHSPWSRVVCFAGTGPGEVLAAGDARKLVGLSQRRTRDHARFQCCALLAWDPGALVPFLAPPFPDGASVEGLEPVAAGVGRERAGPLLGAFEAVLRAV